MPDMVRPGSWSRPAGGRRSALSHFRLCRTFGGDGAWWLAEQDPVAEEREAGPAIHLPFDHFVLVFTPSVRPL
jgi:hypothetical protein